MRPAAAVCSLTLLPGNLLKYDVFLAHALGDVTLHHVALRLLNDRGMQYWWVRETFAKPVVRGCGFIFLTPTRLEDDSVSNANMTVTHQKRLAARVYKSDKALL